MQGLFEDSSEKPLATQPGKSPRRFILDGIEALEGDATYLTNIDIDRLVHTHPRLREQRDRFVDAFGVWYAREATREVFQEILGQYVVERVEPAIERLQETLDQLAEESIADSMLAAMIVGGVLDHERLRERETEILSDTFGMALGIGGLASEESLGPVERMRRIYAVRGAQLADELPETSASRRLLTEMLGGEGFISERRDPTRGKARNLRLKVYSTLREHGIEKALALLASVQRGDGDIGVPTLDYSQVVEAIVDDMIMTSMRRLESDGELLDELVEEQILERLDREFEDIRVMLASLREFQTSASDDEFERRVLERRRGLGDEDLPWLELAREVGHPVALEGTS
jgi:hypothetical protein